MRHALPQRRHVQPQARDRPCVPPCCRCCWRFGRRLALGLLLGPRPGRRQPVVNCQRPPFSRSLTRSLLLRLEAQRRRCQPANGSDSAVDLRLSRWLAAIARTLPATGSSLQSWHFERGFVQLMPASCRVAGSTAGDQLALEVVQLDVAGEYVCSRLTARHSASVLPSLASCNPRAVSAQALPAPGGQQAWLSAYTTRRRAATGDDSKKEAHQFRAGGTLPAAHSAPRRQQCLRK